MNEAKRKSVCVKLVALFALSLLTFSLRALEISNRYRSPRNPERRVRRSTSLIVLHTTEAPERSSLNKLSERGEAHYCVTESGRIYAIVDRDREAYHAGRSMWNAKEDVDNCSIGIECVGYHDKPMGIVQLKAIASLVKELKKMYRIDDSSVVCHSHVAYGAPNKWQKRRHRGRKRCGMLFATQTVRQILELSSKPRRDPDTRAGRLAVGDPYLNRVLYGNLDTMAAHYNTPRRGAALAARNDGGKDLPAKPPSPKVAAPPSSGGAKKKNVAIVAAAQPEPKSEKDLKARGYILKGVVSKGRTASSVAGARWNSPSTYYVVRGKLTNGSKVNPAKIEVGTAIWMK